VDINDRALRNIVADRKPSRKMPAGTLIPHSNGEGGKVIATGQGPGR